MRPHGAGIDLVPLAVQRVLLEPVAAVTGRKVSRPTCSVTAHVLEPVEELGREVQPGGRAAADPASRGVHRLVALGVGERLADVGRQRASRRRLALDVERSQRPSPSGSRAARAELLARPEPARRPDRPPRSPFTPSCSTSSTSTAPPVARRRRSRAGTTRESLTTDELACESVREVAKREMLDRTAILRR